MREKVPVQSLEIRHFIKKDLREPFWRVIYLNDIAGMALICCMGMQELFHTTNYCSMHG